MPRKKKAKKEEVYHVEVITKARVSDEGGWEYLVKWAGYDSDADSWEPSGNVQQCERLLASFWKHVGMDDKDYPIGYEITAQKSWINKEKRYFDETFNKQKSDKSSKERRQSRSDILESTTDDSESRSQSSDEEASASIPVKKNLAKKARVVDTESESEFEDRSRMQANVHSRTTTPPAKDFPKVPAPVKRQAANGSLPVAPPLKATVTRTHQDQKSHPLVKPMDLLSRSVEAGSSLSTKQRIAAGFPPPPTGPKPLPPGPKKSFHSLSFKKNKPPVPLSNQVKDTTVLNTSDVTPASPVAQLTSITNNADVIASPQLMDIDPPVDLFGSILEDPELPSRSPEAPTAILLPKSCEEINAEEFLKTVDIPMLHDPLEVDISTDQFEQPTNELPKLLAIPKIPKKWKWSGDLFISTSESKEEFLCAINIADPSGRANSSHINLLLSSLDSLKILKLYSIMDLSPLLQACGKSQYFGRLESNEASEEVVIEGLGNHLLNEQLAAAIPLLLDDTEVAVLIIFPRAQQGLAKALQVPEHLLLGNPLLVTLLPFLVSSMTSTQVTGSRSIRTVQQSLLSLQDMSHHSQEIMLHQAMVLTGFPKALLEFMNSSSMSRQYCIWPMSNQQTLGLDTAMLQCILKSTKAASARLEEDVRVIFISNRHLEMLHTMPSLVMKRANSPEIQFWTYGYSSDIPYDGWRVQEVYPLGGILTFTSSALVEDLIGCHHLIAQIIEHPLWDCYLIPEVLAVSHLLWNNGNLSSSSESCLGPFLDLINLGSISVFKVPKRGHFDQADWLSLVINPSSGSGHKLLDVYLEELRSLHITPDMTTEQLITFTNDEITKNLSNAQIQPAFMENYRRFVVIRASSEDGIPSDRAGLEWLPLSQFSFKDDYFQL